MIFIELRDLPKGISGNVFYSSSHFTKRGELKKSFIKYLYSQGFEEFVELYKRTFLPSDTIQIKIEINKAGTWDCDNIGYMMCKVFNDTLKNSGVIVSDDFLYIDKVSYEYCHFLDPNIAVITITKSNLQYEKKKEIRVKGQKKREEKKALSDGKQTIRTVKRRINKSIKRKA